MNIGTQMKAISVVRIAGPRTNTPEPVQAPTHEPVPAVAAAPVRELVTA